MRTTHPNSALVRYQNEVTDLMEAGEPFGLVESAIDLADVTEEEKAALWLLAFSMRDPGEQRRDAHTYLSHLSYA
jgi:hypothetical protein